MEGNMDNLEIWIWKAKKSGLVGRPPDPDFWKKVKKSALKKSGLAKLFLLKDVNKTRKMNYGSHPVSTMVSHFGAIFPPVAFGTVVVCKNNTTIFRSEWSGWRAAEKRARKTHQNSR